MTVETNKRLLDHITAIEQYLEEKKGLADDIRDRFALAKAEGYDAATIRWAIKERAIEEQKRKERDALRETYACQLGMEF